METDNVIPSERELLEKNIKLNRRRFVTNLILILVWVLLATYVVINIQEFKALNSDVCRLCEAKTGGQCLASVIAPIQQKDSGGLQQPINLSNIQG